MSHLGDRLDAIAKMTETNDPVPLNAQPQAAGKFTFLKETDENKVEEYGTDIILRFRESELTNTSRITYKRK
jgi:hypothetical protein